MDFVHEYALLVVVALPVAIVAGLNVILAVSGESGTLLLPSLKPFPSVDFAVAVESTPEVAPVATDIPSANYEEFREAA